MNVVLELLIPVTFCLLGLISAAIGLRQKSERNALGLFVLGGQLAVVGLVLPPTLAIKWDVDEISLLVDKLEEIRRSQQASDLFRAGSKERVLAELARNSKEVEVIWNTHIISDGGETSWSNEEVAWFKELFANLRSSKDRKVGVLLDVVGVSSTTDSMTEREVQALHQHVESVSVDGLDYRPYFHTGRTPFLNFMVFEYRNAPRKVAFGWGGFSDASFKEVYCSTDPKLVEMFIEMHRSLRRFSDFCEQGLREAVSARTRASGETLE